ncbi:MAG: Clp protease [Rhodococcus sp.]|uniref:Clp protease N-terminal domain-containing protein n=1 Tax=Rhodococcus TaxID=1827 RepID=UPI0016BBA38D|nr:MULTISPECIES: Clp protease N-terminal domain-containing protein [Rhodococcus]NLV78785.1 Clp protease [Rhodococcus sp. (in: high G+C Gram-positive bacteria)]
MFERFTDGARAAVVAAQTEAVRAHTDRITGAHLLLGVLVADESLRTALADVGLTPDGLRSALAGRADDPLGPDDAKALESIGIDLDEVRSRLEASFGDGVLDRATPPGKKSRLQKLFGDHVPFTSDAKGALELALREAVARREKAIRPEHLALGVLRGDDPATASLIDAHVPRATLRRVLTDRLDSAA